MSYVGRIGSYDRLDYVINSVNEKSGTCEITRLYPPTEQPPEPNSPIVVDFKKVEFFTGRFDDAFPFAEAMCFSSFNGSNVPSGTILDLSDGKDFPTQLVRDGAWNIESSVRLIGEAVDPAKFREVGYEGGTVMYTPITVSLNNDTDLIEFENLVFCGDENCCPVKFVKAANAHFRRCRFSSLSRGVDILRENGARDCGQMAVEFEDCIFEECTGICVVISGDCSVQFLNCLFRGNFTDAKVTHGASLHVRWCTFENMECGVNGYKKSHITSINNTFINARDHPLCLYGASGVTVEHCLFTSCRIVLYLWGPKCTSVSFQSCAIRDCKLAFRIMSGKIDMTVRNVSFHGTDCEVLYTRWDVIGNIDFEECTTEGQPIYQICSGRKCYITNSEGSRLKYPSPSAISHMIESAQEWPRSPFDVYQLRLLKKAGVGNVSCFQCQKVEPPGVNYKKCARCKKVCYCSRVCQVRLLFLRGVCWLMELIIVFSFSLFFSFFFFTESALGDAPTILYFVLRVM